MSRIKSKDTKPEIVLRKFLFGHEFRYRLHDKSLSGKPDLVLPKYRTIIFVNGCFWHGHEGCRHYVIPKTRTEWWLKKINGNKSEDSTHIALLLEMGWKILIIWECELSVKHKEATLNRLLDKLSLNLDKIK